MNVLYAGVTFAYVNECIKMARLLL